LNKLKPFTKDLATGYSGKRRIKLYGFFPNEPFSVNKGINHAIERLFPYIAQSAGYYSGICMTDSYAQVRINSLEYILREKKRN
jgi:rhamnosyltransferase